YDGITRLHRKPDSQHERRHRGKIQREILRPFAKFIERMCQINIERQEAQIHQAKRLDQKPRLKRPVTISFRHDFSSTRLPWPSTRQFYAAWDSFHATAQNPPLP